MERNSALSVHLLYSLQFVAASPLRILESENRAFFLNFPNISDMREKTPDIPNIRDVFEKKRSDHKNTALNVHTVLSGKKQVRFNSAVYRS